MNVSYSGSTSSSGVTSSYSFGSGAGSGSGSYQTKMFVSDIDNLKVALDWPLNRGLELVVVSPNGTVYNNETVADGFS